MAATDTDTSTDSLGPLLEPASIAIIGASNDPTRIGGRPLLYTQDAGFAGPIYPVNPNRDSVQLLVPCPACQATVAGEVGRGAQVSPVEELPRRERPPAEASLELCLCVLDRQVEVERPEGLLLNAESCERDEQLIARCVCGLRRVSDHSEERSPRALRRVEVTDARVSETGDRSAQDLRVRRAF